MPNLALYKNLPAVVTEYLFDSSNEQAFRSAVLRFQFDEDVAYRILLLADEVVLKTLIVSALPAKIVEIAHVDEDNALQITKDLIGYRLLPLEQFVPGLGEEVTRLGIDRKMYAGEVVQKQKKSVEDFLKEAIKGSGVTLPDASLASRLEFILTAYLRGVRTNVDTIAAMTRSVKVGGLAMAEDQAGKLVSEVDRAKDSVEIATGILPEARPAEDHKDLAARDSEDLAKRYLVLTGKTPSEVVHAPTLARASVAVSKTEELSRSAAKLDRTAQAVLRQSAPRPASVLPKLSTSSVPPSVLGERPQVADVKYVHTLAGPVEELNRMSLVDFHRLASDPEQASAKIEDTIQLLKQESYEKMVMGVAAWRESPVHKLYVAISGEALRTGRPMDTIASDWRAEGKDVLTPAEVKAIVRLNSRIRF